MSGVVSRERKGELISQTTLGQKLFLKIYFVLYFPNLRAQSF